MKRSYLEAARAARAGGAPVAVVTHLDSGAQAMVLGDRVEGDLRLAEPVVAAARDALAHDRSRLLDHDGARLFIHVFNAPLRLVVVGAVHIAQALAPMAALAGYAVTVVDPRGAFATRARFPGVTLSDEWPDEALERLKPDSRTAVVTLTHDPKLDDPALEVALRSDAFYIGSLGSSRTHAARLRRLAAKGFAEADLARIHGPLGLDLGGRSPGEIAVAALAQITQVLHRSREA